MLCTICIHLHYVLSDLRCYIWYWCCWCCLCYRCCAGRLQQGHRYILLSIVVDGVSPSILSNHRANIVNVWTNTRTVYTSNAMGDGVPFVLIRIPHTQRSIHSATLCVVRICLLACYFFLFSSCMLAIVTDGCCKTNWATIVSGWRFRLDIPSCFFVYKYCRISILFFFGLLTNLDARACKWNARGPASISFVHDFKHFKRLPVCNVRTKL